MSKEIDMLLRVYESIKNNGGNEILDVEDFLRYLIDYISSLGVEGGKLEYNDVMNILLYLYNNGD
mgnify:FL=1|tara:strand:+ start:104 stop:298 length:195 start_codon:yes stop_codon:yes gene_type:complete